MASSTGKIDLSDNRQPELYAAYISTYSLAVIAVCLRLVSRNYLTKAGLWWDDFIICLSLVSTRYSPRPLEPVQGTVSDLLEGFRKWKFCGHAPMYDQVQD